MRANPRFWSQYGELLFLCYHIVLKDKKLKLVTFSPFYLEDSFDILFVSVFQFWDCPALNKAFKFTHIPRLEGKTDFLDLTASKEIFKCFFLPIAKKQHFLRKCFKIDIFFFKHLTYERKTKMREFPGESGKWGN